MPHQLAIDFGTTNTVLARWNADLNYAETVMLPGLSQPAESSQPALVPSLVYVDSEEVVVGHAVRQRGLDRQRTQRLFRNFKRGIVAPQPESKRVIDGNRWTDWDAGRAFLSRVLGALPFPISELETLVIATPVVAFEQYITWLDESVGNLSREQIRVIDESTAAALGYAVTEPGAMVLVVDFGGGTLDLSVVQLPESGSKVGGVLRTLLGLKGTSTCTARVLAKSGQMLGGSDVDHWLAEEALRQIGINADSLGDDETPLLTACEALKIQLSSQERAELAFTIGERAHHLQFTRAELEDVLEAHGFYAAMRRVVEKTMYLARQRGIYREDIRFVLMIGGTSLMPSVQQLMHRYFTEGIVRCDKPFTAVAEGALQLARGASLEDYLTHSFGLRHLENGAPSFSEIIPMGTPCPTPKPFELTLCAAHPGQQEIEFVIGEIDSETIEKVDVRYEGGVPVFVTGDDELAVQTLEGNVCVPLTPPGKPGEDRLKASFSIEADGLLKLSVTDLQTGKMLLENHPLTRLR